MRMHGKVALVTGAARGIGLACAHRFLDEGAQVVLADRDAAALQAACASLPPGRAMHAAADVSSRTDVERMVAEAVARFGRIDVLLNNAGIVHAAPFLAMAEEDFDRVIASNLKSTFLVGQAVARHMVEHDVRGSIVNMSSVNAVVALPDLIAYGASKAAIGQMTKTMAIALAPHGIRVNAIGPGTIATELARNAVLGSEAARRKVMSRTPLGRLGEPDEVARVAVFLACDDSAYMTGQTVYADGGRLALNYTVEAPPQ